MNIIDKSILSINRISEAGPADAFWPVVFIGGCNLRCPYCINASIAIPPPSAKYIPLDQVVKTLNGWKEEGVMISGGEPLSNPNILQIVTVLAQDQKVGISTNGTNPYVLHELMSRLWLQYVAIDFKFSPRCKDWQRKLEMIGGDPLFGFKLFGSLNRIGTWRSCHPSVTASEIRITLYPPLVEEFDVRDAAVEAVLSHSRLVLQQYRPNTMFDGGYNHVEPYSSEEVEKLKAAAEEASRGKLEVEVRYP